MTDRQITFIHLTDLHIGDHENDDHLYSDTTANMARFKEIIAGLDPKPSFVLATGDLANQGDLPSYHKLKEIMADFDVPVFYALGNHDVMKGRAAFYEGMLDRAENGDPTYDHDGVVEGVHVVVLDSSEPGKVGGSLTDAQFDWLAQTLDRHAEAPKLIALHHGPAFVNNPPMEWETLRWQDSQRLAGVLRAYDVVGIMCGHLHSDRVTHWHGIPVVMATGPHMALDPSYPEGGIRMINGTSFGLCRILPDGLMVNFITPAADRQEIVAYTPEMVQGMMKKAQAAAAEAAE